MPETSKEVNAIIAEKPDAKALLDAANSASERVAGLHVAFMAVCAYVLVIVFGTTDLDLLMGKGVRLPVVNVDVPIVGFYAFAPYLVVLVHFNLLLQLQLLSRKLFAFDAAAPEEEGIGSMRNILRALGLKMRKEDRDMTSDEAYMQLGHSASLLKAVLKVIEAGKRPCKILCQRS